MILRDFCCFSPNRVGAMPPTSYATHRWSLFAVYALALVVNFGVALVSLTKLLVVFAVCAKVFCLCRDKRIRCSAQAVPWTALAVVAAIAWMALSWFWSEALPQERGQSLGRHARLWIFLAVFYLLQTRREALTALCYLVAGQMFVLISSWLLWLGVPLPWAMTNDAPHLGILFTSTLEQPVMSTLMLLVIWFFRQELPEKWRTAVVGGCVVLTIANVFFVMTGRTGYLVMLLAIALAVYWQMPRRWRVLAWLLPVLMMGILMLSSERFQNRVLEVKRDVLSYQQNKTIEGSSQGQRLDYWVASMKATADRPWLGSGVGSWRHSYLKHGGRDTVNFTTNPHQQYLLWSVEAGLIGLVFLLAIFIAVYRDSLTLAPPGRQALQATLGILFLMGMMNCPLFGAGISEFFLLLIAALLATKEPEPSTA